MGGSVGPAKEGKLFGFVGGEEQDVPLAPGQPLYGYRPVDTQPGAGPLGTPRDDRRAQQFREHGEQGRGRGVHLDGEAGPGRRAGDGRTADGDARREVREERQPLGAGRPVLGGCNQLLVPVSASDSVAQPAQRPGCGEHHPHRVPATRHCMAESMYTRLGVGRESR